MRYELLTINGLTLNVGFAGEENNGWTVLLVHGFPDDNTVWRNQIPVLVAAGYRVIALDTRGCGASEIPVLCRHYHREYLVADLVDLLDQLKIEQVKLVAHDWGAVIGWQFAIRHPQRIERFLAFSVGHPNSYAHGGLKQKMIGWYTLFFQLRGVAVWLLKLGDWALFRATFSPGEEWPHIKERLSRPGRLLAGMRYYIANVGLLFARPAPVNVPVLGVWSDQDRFLVEKQMTSSGRFVTRQWQYQKLAGAHHWLQLDQSEAVNRIILDYLK